MSLFPYRLISFLVVDLVRREVATARASAAVTGALRISCVAYVFRTPVERLLDPTDHVVSHHGSLGQLLASFANPSSYVVVRPGLSDRVRRWLRFHRLVMLDVHRMAHLRVVVASLPEGASTVWHRL